MGPPLCCSAVIQYDDSDNFLVLLKSFTLITDPIASDLESIDLKIHVHVHVTRIYREIE